MPKKKYEVLLTPEDEYCVVEITVNTVLDICVSARRRKEAMPGASLSDDNAAMAQITGALFTAISAMQYECLVLIQF